VAPIIGGLIGGALFKFAVEAFLPDEPESLTVSEPEPNSTVDHRDTSHNA
jgi:glycerol uptake facilitator protein